MASTKPLASQIKYGSETVDEKLSSLDVLQKGVGVGSYALYGGISNNTRISITHNKNSYCNYTMIRLRSGNIRTFRKVYPSGATTANNATNSGATAKALAISRGYNVTINADGGRTVAGGLRPIGIQVSDGIAYANWAPGEQFNEALMFMRDGTIREANISDGKTAQQWVDEGAWFSTGFGFVCVRDSVAVNLDDKPSPFDAATISARTIVGQQPDGTILIVMVEGITGTYGINATKCGELMVDLGCKIAQILDGGGSTQCWWGDIYAMPSSDSNFTAERVVPALLVIDAPIPQFDTGWMYVVPAAGVISTSGGFSPIAIRQRGPDVHVAINTAANFQANTAFQISDVAIPPRFQPPNTAMIRASLSGSAGAQGELYYASDRLYAKSSQTLTYLNGQSYWPVKFSGLPAVQFN